MSRNESGPRITPDAFDDSYRDRRSPARLVQLPPGTRLANKYEIQGVLGVGGMGVVHEATQLEVGRTVAIKLISQQERDPQMEARLVREAVILSRLNHANIVSLFDTGLTDSGLRFFVMEYLEGRSLSSVLRSGPLDPRRAVRIASQICRGLDAAHTAGVVHRDLKPSNVYLVTMDRRDPEGFVKILDFGIARFLLVDPEAPGITQTKQLIGTPRYMSPEQIRGESLDARSDIYALGCVLFELITGRPPFVSRTDLATIDEHLHRPPPRFSDVNATLGEPDLEEIVRTMLAKTPGARFPSAEAVEAALSLWSARASTESEARAVSRAKDEPLQNAGDTREGRGRSDADRGVNAQATRGMRGPGCGSGSGAPSMSEPKANGAARDEDAAQVENREAERTPVLPNGLSSALDETKTPAVHSSAVVAVEVLDEVLRNDERPPETATVAPRGSWWRTSSLWHQRLIFFAAGFVLVTAFVALFGRRRDPDAIVIPPPKVTALSVPRDVPVQATSAAIEAVADETPPSLVEEHRRAVGAVRARRAAGDAAPETPVVENTKAPEPRIRVRNVRVEHGPSDVTEIASVLQARAKDIAHCFTRTQRSGAKPRTLRLRFMSSEGSTTVNTLPDDTASQRFSECVRSLEPPISLPVSKTRSIYLFSADVGSGVAP